MARRKKEPADVHRARIAAAAERLFSQRGITAVTVEDIAREAGYSKATLYVYFLDKEEIVHLLVLRSMELLRGSIRRAMGEETEVRGRYRGICLALEDFQEQYPYYFETALGRISLDFTGESLPPVEQDIFDTGERINDDIAALLEEGIRRGEFRRDLQILPTVFAVGRTVRPDPDGLGQGGVYLGGDEALKEGVFGLWISYALPYDRCKAGGGGE